MLQINVTAEVFDLKIWIDFELRGWSGVWEIEYWAEVGTFEEKFDEKCKLSVEEGRKIVVVRLVTCESVVKSVVASASKGIDEIKNEFLKKNYQSS